MKKGRKQEGYWLSVGTGFGIIFGLLIGMPFENSALGLLVGVAIGGIIGYFLEKKFNPNPVRLTKEQRRMKIILAILAFIVALVIAFILIVVR